MPTMQMLKLNVLQANFILEIWSSYLFIVAKSLTINGNTYQV